MQGEDAETLADLLTHHRPDEAQIVALGRRLLETLAPMHAQSPSRAHGGLNPETVVVHRDGRVEMLQSRGGKAGAPGYLAPEQALGRTTAASDVYAVGAILLHLLSRRDPASFPLERLRISFRSAVACSPALGVLLDRLLDPDERRRPGSAAVALGALAAVERHEVPGRSRRWLRYATFAAALLLLVAGGGVVLRKQASVARGPAAPRVVKVSLLRDGFVPASGEALALPHGAYSRLARDRPPAIVREPARESSLRHYGVLAVGQGLRIPFVLDGAPTVNMLLHLDRNRNGDLTDDGPPLRNEGDGAAHPDADGFTGFGTRIVLPWKLVIPGAAFPGDVEVWAFVNRHHWENGDLAYTTSAALVGHVSIEGKRYLAAVVETVCDLDFTNDGIVVDTNGNRLLEEREWIAPDTLLDLQGEGHRFEITW